jgi:hypothetical protein
VWGYLCAVDIMHMRAVEMDSCCTVDCRQLIAATATATSCSSSRLQIATSSLVQFVLCLLAVSWSWVGSRWALGPNPNCCPTADLRSPFLHGHGAKCRKCRTLHCCTAALQMQTRPGIEHAHAVPRRKPQPKMPNAVSIATWTELDPAQLRLRLRLFGVLSIFERS